MIYSIMIIETSRMNITQSECIARTFISQQYIPYAGSFSTNISKTSENSAIIEVVMTVAVCDLSRFGLIYNKVRQWFYKRFEPPRVVITSL